MSMMFDGKVGEMAEAVEKSRKLRHEAVELEQMAARKRAESQYYDTLAHQMFHEVTDPCQGATANR